MKSDLLTCSFLIFIISGMVFISGCTQGPKDKGKTSQEETIKKPKAKLEFKFSKKELGFDEKSVQVDFSVKNTGGEKFPKADYVLVFTRFKETEEGREGYVIRRFNISGPIKPDHTIRRNITLPIYHYLGSPGTYSFIFSLSFEKVKERKPWRSEVIEDKERRINLTVLSPSEGIEVEEKKLKEALSICKKIEEHGTQPAERPLQYRCLALVKGDPSFCNVLSETKANYCYRDVALATENTAICDKISNDGKKYCKALIERDPSKCSGYTYANYCYAGVAALTQNASICNLSGYSTCKAIVLDDVSFCRNARTEDCYQKLALLTGKEKVCDKLEGRDDLKDIRDLTREVRKCKKMARRKIKDCSVEEGTGTDCNMIPLVTEEPSECNKFEGQRQNICYFSVAARVGNLLPLEILISPY